MRSRRSIVVPAVALAILVAACTSAPPRATAPGLNAGPTHFALPTPSSDALGATAEPTQGDWPVYHSDALRTGNVADFPRPGGSLSLAWKADLDGAVYAEPLVVGGYVIAVTENNTVYALNSRSGAIFWRKHLGTPVHRSALPCGNIDPLGITGTPAFDPKTGSLFVVAEVSGPHHVLYALNGSSGATRWSREVDLPGDTPVTHQQRPALAVANGYVYIGFGGLAGDCGQYTGKVVGVPTTGLGDTIAYRVPVQREGAVWATGGPVIDDDGYLYVSTGNGSSTDKYDGSDSVVKLSPKLQMIDRFAPGSWAEDNAADADLGSASPVLVSDQWVFIAGKSGTGYVLRQTELGGIGGQVSSAPVCAAFGGMAQDGNVVYVPCVDSIRKVTIGDDGTIAAGWTSETGVGGAPPVVGGGVVWSVNQDNGNLYALDPDTGSVLASTMLGKVPHFASPTLWNGLVLVGTMAGVVAMAV